MTQQQILAIRRVVATLVVIVSCSRPSTAERSALELQLVPIAKGMQQAAKFSGLDDIRATQIYQTGRRFGVTLHGNGNELIAAQCVGGKFFAAYYTTLQNALDDRPYVIQRIKMTKLSFDDLGKVASNSTSYLVEVMRTENGKTKSYDQHFAGYSLRDAARRVIVKEFEIGVGSIPNVCEGNRWPYAPATFYKELQGYDQDAAMHNAVSFERSVKYTVIADFCADGTFRVMSPELGFHLPSQKPERQTVARGVKRSNLSGFDASRSRPNELHPSRSGSDAPTNSALQLLSGQSLLQMTHSLR